MQEENWQGQKKGKYGNISYKGEAIPSTFNGFQENTMLHLKNFGSLKKMCAFKITIRLALTKRSKSF